MARRRKEPAAEDVSEVRGGWLPVDRKFFEDPDEGVFWKEKRKFSRAEAWLDLLAYAAYKPHARVAGSKVIVKLEVGQFLGSWSFFQLRWEWSERMVRDFLGLLLEMGWLKAGRTTRSGRIYSIDSAHFIRLERREGGAERGEQMTEKRRGLVGDLSGKRREEKKERERERNMNSTATSARDAARSLDDLREIELDMIAGALDCEDLSVDEAEELRQAVVSAGALSELDRVTMRRQELIEVRTGEDWNEFMERTRRVMGKMEGSING